MSCLKESIAEAMKTLPTIYTYTGPDEVVHPEDPNLKDVNHLAELIRKVCNLNFDDLPSDRDLPKEQVVEIVELVERELLSHPSVKPVRRDKLVSDLLAIRVKDENQLIEELDKIGMEVIKKYQQIGTTLEEAIMKSLFMWDGCLNIDKVCRLKDIHGIEPQDRMQVHSWLVNKSSSRNRRLDETSSADTTKQLERQATQLDKITIMLHSIQKDMKSTKGESKLINQLQSQIKQLRTQISQIQKNIAKRNFTTATISSRKKMLRHNKRQ